MSGLYTARQKETSHLSLGHQLRRLREESGRLGREVAAGVEMDSGLLSKIENGKRAVTQAQLAALAKFFKVPLDSLEERRLAEELLKYYGSHPGLAAATAIVREEAGEYLVKKKPTAVSKPAKAVNKRGKSK